MQINEDGLQLVKTDKDALSMVARVKEGFRYLMVYLDHEQAAKTWDDVVANPILHLPPVISPMKKCSSVSNEIVEKEVQMTESDAAIEGGARRRSTRQRSFIQEKDDDRVSGSDSDSDTDYVPEIVDSDNEVEDGDDDLFQQYADQEPKEDKKLCVEGQMSDDEFFEAADSDDETVKFNNFKPFVAEDMEDPKFHTGQLFQSIDQLRKAVREHSCK
jgi:hypothetical protein